MLKRFKLLFLVCPDCKHCPTNYNGILVMNNKTTDCFWIYHYKTVTQKVSLQFDEDHAYVVYFSKWTHLLYPGVNMHGW